jgi:hypothetical protein
MSPETYGCSKLIRMYLYLKYINLYILKYLTIYYIIYN